MSLTVGTRFGAYEIVGPLGSGGMGEVYRATDTKLKREVALKVLPDAIADDPERLGRFQREAEVMASLNNPNIAQIYGLEESDGTTALVLELVEGATLEERVAAGPVPAEEALDIAMQIADALEAAHSRNIVHRDLKPANIKLKPDGTVKVLDFGIAKALTPDLNRTEPPAPILTTPATQVGVILGTAAYMSPEQARGQPVDQRADIWAFGCVLYEMLTGQLAFGAEDVPTTLAKVIANDTDLDTLPPTVSPAARRTIELCLQKDPRKRVRDIGDVKLALGGAFETVSPRTVDGGAADQPLWRRPLPIATGAVLTTVLIIGLTREALWPNAEPGLLPVNRLEYSMPANLSFRNPGRSVMALSRDGRQFVYNSTQGFYLRTMGGLDSRLLPGTESEARAPTFSPDGQQLAYYHEQDATLMRIAISGGAPVAIAPVASNVFGLSWGTDGSILIGQPEGILRVSADGGTPELIVPIEPDERIYGPRLLPDRDTVLFSIGPNWDWDGARIVAQSLATGVRKVLIEGGNDARYLSTGHLVYALGDELFAVPFDLEGLSVTGGAVPLVQGVMRAVGDYTGAANYAVSDNGTLVYVSGGVGIDPNRLVWVDRNGREEAVAIEPSGYVSVRISPDGTRVALDDRNDDNALWVWDFAGETRTRLTSGEKGGTSPVWTVDGSRIAYDPGTGDIEIKAANNTGRPERTATGLGERASLHFSYSPDPLFFTPSGTELVFRDNSNPETKNDIGMIAIGSNSEPDWLLRESYGESNATLSADGHWMAYQSDETGQFEIYVRPFPNVEDDRFQVSNVGGVQPLWSRDGAELFYLEPGTPNRLISVPVSATGSAFAVGQRNPVLVWPYLGTAFVGTVFVGQSFDISLDGTRFLAIRRADAARSTERFIIVTNWFEELRRLVPSDGDT